MSYIGCIKLDLEIVGFSNNGGIEVSGHNTSTEFVVDTENFVSVIPWSISDVSPIQSDNFAILGFFVDSCNWSFLFGVKGNYFGDDDCFSIGSLSFLVDINDLYLDGDWVITAFFDKQQIWV